MSPSAGVVIVGGSLAGLHAAEKLRAEGWTGAVTVIDRDQEPRFDRPPLSKQYLAGAVDAESLMLRDDQRLADLGVDWRFGCEATRLVPDRRLIELTDAEGAAASIAYDELILATGVSPIIPPSLSIPNVHTLRDKADADRLRAELHPGASLIVIGAGFVGLETAATFRAVGAEVTVVESLDLPLQRQLGPTVGEAIRRLHERHGVVFHLGRQATAVEAVESSDAGVAVTLDDGTVLRGSALLVAVGSVPGTAWLQDSGLVLESGVLADGHLRVGQHIHAIGDVVRWPHPLLNRPVRIEHWSTAIDQAAYVAKRIAGTGGDAPFDGLPYFWSDQYDKKIQAHGFPDPSAEIEVLDGDLDGDRFAVVYVVDGRAIAVVAVNHPKQVLAGRRRVLAELALQEATS